MQVVVVGGGIMGSSVALALRDRRPDVDVVLLERAVPGAEASSAAAGMLGAQLEAHGARPLVTTFVRARDAYGTWADELRRRTGIDVGHRVSGVLRIATTDDEARGLEDEVRWQKEARLHAEFLGAESALRVEPELTKRVVAAAHFPDDAQVDPPSLLRALAVALARAGVDVRSGSTVERVVERGGRCEGVLLDQGELRADAVVLAAGSWSSLVPGIPSSMPPVKPARGQMVLLEERPPCVRTIVAGAGTYTVPRGDGRVLVGSTLEFVGFRREVTAGGVHAILAGALACVPSLADAQFASSWSNFRPFSEGPMLGASSLPGLFLATGHHRNGILLAKHTADVVTDAVLGAPRDGLTRPT